MKRYIGILLFCMFCVASAAALTATITEIAGKVEYKLPNQDWKAATIGTVLTKGAMVSTGFKSTAIITMEAATLTVKPVTRLAIEELIKAENSVKSQMFLMTGRVRAEVTPKQGEKADFKVKSPTATASVRGTGFEFDGYSLLVDHGAVQLGTDNGAACIVGMGEFSTVDERGMVTAPVPVSAGASLISASTDRVENILSDSVARTSDLATGLARSSGEGTRTGDVTIRIGWEN